MNTYKKRIKRIGLLLIFLLGLHTLTWAEASPIVVQTSLVNGTSINEADLTFNYTLKYQSESGQTKYKLPEKILVNDKPPKRYGNTYRVKLQEGENRIAISYHDGEDYHFDTFLYYLDTSPPYINVRGIYDHMMVNKSHIKFGIEVGDLQSIPEALQVSVYLNDLELKETYGFYQGLLKQSPLLGKKQKVATNDSQPTENIITIKATDALGNESEKEYHIIFAGDTTQFRQLRYLIEKVPGLLPQNAIYDTMGHYSEVGVALDDSNITMLGTYGGYVLLGHDQPILNGQGDDILVNGHWSDEGYPLTSIWVMRDWNNNQLPDDEWYYIDDGIEARREIINSKASYDLKNISRYKDDKSQNKNVVSQLLVRAPYSSTYFKNAKALNPFNFTGSHYTLYGNLNVFHNGPIKELAFNVKGYDLDKAYTLDGQAVQLNSVDFVKVYTNTFDLQEGVGSVMPAVNYVLARHDTGEALACDPKLFTILDEHPKYDSGDVLKLKPADVSLALQYTRMPPMVNEDHVFVFPSNEESVHQPFKKEVSGIELFYPYNRTTIENILLEIATKEEVPSLTWSQLMAQRYYVNNKLAHDDLTTSEEGQLEFLQLSIEKQWQERLKASFSTLKNDYEQLIELKKQLDYLEDEAFLAWPGEDLQALENRLLKMINYESKQYTMKDLNGQSLSITPVENMSYILSSEELERQEQADFVFSAKELPKGKQGLFAFDLSVLKSENKMNQLYRPVKYQIDLTGAWTDQIHLYYVKSSGPVKIPVEVISNNRIQFSTDRLGWFYVGVE